MRKVSVIGAAYTKFGEHWEKSFRELAVEAGTKALQDAGVEGKDIQALYGASMASGTFIGQEHIGALLADQMGLNPIPAIRCEAACASGGVAFRQAYLAVASGAYDLVAVGGVEKMTDVSVEEAATALGGAGDQEWELFYGATFPAIYALMAQKYLRDFNAKEEDFAAVSVKNHYNGAKNPLAQYQKEITIEDVMNSGYISTPLKLLDCSPISDGAAAVILCDSEHAKKYTDLPIEIIASAQASDTLALASRHCLTELHATKVAAREAYKQSGLQPKDIDVVEVHDCFTNAEVLAIEDLGFFEKGKGAKASTDGATALNAEISVNTSGGLKSCGHPVAATGIKQVCEIVEQLRGGAKERQVKNADIGMTHNVGGSGATVVIHLFKRGD